jgi:uncharacterized protein YbjT (DUF2867 family)
MTTILVTGASGTVGSNVVRRLLDGGAPVRVLVRDAEKAVAVLGNDVDIALGDFGDPGTLEAALKGVDRVFLSCPNDPRQVDYETNVIDVVARGGVQRLVKLSANGARVGSPLEFWDWQGRIEQHLDGTGVPTVVLRPNFYMTNVLASAEAIKHTGQLFLPAADARVAMVDPRDVAAAAVAALHGAGADGGRYLLTGPEPITFESVAEAAGRAAGYDVRFVSVPDDAARSAMTEAGLPPFIVDNLIKLFGFLRQGAQDATTDDVRTLTGRRPGSFAEFAADHARAFAR